MPLGGVKVVDLTRIVSGPFCTSLLADLGAEIIKVETPGGDPVRRQGHLVNGQSAYFAQYNHGKRSVCLDLYSEAGRKTLQALLRDADVLVENFKPGVLDKMGLGSERLAEINPRLIHCNINGFGLSGPLADRPAFDFVVQAMTGFMSINGFEDGPPVRVGSPIADLVAGLYGALGVIAALHARGKGGKGDFVSVSMMASMASMLSFYATNYLNGGNETSRVGNDHGLVAPYGLFRASDGQIAIAPSNDDVYRRFVDALGAHRLRDDPALASNEQRTARRAEVNAMVEEITSTMPSSHWVQILNTAGVPCSEVRKLGEAFSDPQMIEQAIVDTSSMCGEKLRIVSNPLRFQNHPSRRGLPTPELGEHTDEVLQISLGT